MVVRSAAADILASDWCLVYNEALSLASIL